MSKIKFFKALWLVVAAVSLLFLLMCCIFVASFDVDPAYELERPYEDALEIQRRAFGREYSCLKFVDGMIWHGKDTSAIAKFIIDKNHVSWEALSNRIYAVQVRNPESTYIMQDKEFSVEDERIGMLSETAETVCEELINGWISLRMSYGADGTSYLYIDGVRITGRPEDRNVHFKKRVGRIYGESPR